MINDPPDRLGRRRDSIENVVLGAHWGMSSKYAETFLVSLRSTGFSGRVVLFVHSISEIDRQALLQWADQLVDVDVPTTTCQRVVARALRFLKVTKGVRRWYAPMFKCVVRHTPSGRQRSWFRSLEFHTNGIQSLRYHFYLDHLRSNGERYSHVLISDVRDVVFQSDPFVPPPDRLEVFLEDPGQRLGTPGFNRRWGEDLYGVEWSGLHDEVVSCSGVTIGPVGPMTGYLELMAAAVDNCTIALGPHDQAIHNWLLRTGSLRRAEVVPNGTGRVLTVSAVNPPETTAGEALRSPDGTTIPIIHQYDRVSELARHFAEATR